MSIFKIRVSVLLFCCLGLQPLTAQLPAKVLDIDISKPAAVIQPTMWGIFFEDINFAADGGLYAELVKNRSFEFPMPMMGWRDIRQNGKGKVLIINDADNGANKRFARITVTETIYGLSNEGFRGMGIYAGKQYNFSVMVRLKENTALKIKVQLLNYSGKIIGETLLTGFDNEWKRYTTSVTSTDTAQKGRLNILFEGIGVIDIDMISLFPADTWKNRPGGLRRDLVEKLADLKPGFIRFPGGCIVEGRDLSNRYQWKKTTGDITGRELIMNRWNVEFRHRPAPDYFQSFGLGFYEYFLLSEDLQSEPLPILGCGMACQFNSAEVAAMDDLQPYIDDALDLIEFANGAIDTKWGKLRHDMGHPAPFNLKYIGVGNEQWEEQYIERYKVFEKAILAKYPSIKIVSGSGPFAEGDYFNYAWKELKQLQPALIDEHYYKPPKWFLDNAVRYDKYERTGPKIFAGEYAAHTKENNNPESRNNWESALAEAAFMTGLERNADIVHMASYAPLLAHVEAWQWRPDLIWFDNLQSVATPNYYVQKLFSNNKGTHTIQLLSGGEILAGKDSIYASAVIDKTTNEVILKLVNTSVSPVTVSLNTGKTQVPKQNMKLTILKSDIRDLYNTLDSPNLVVPVEKTQEIKNNKINISLNAGSLTVLKILYKK